MVIINQETCIGCSACIKDCPASNIELRDNKARILSGCIECSHCVAICPTKSVTIEGYDDSELVEFIKDDFEVDSSKLLNAFKFRRTIRWYQDKKIDRDTLNSILEAGRYTPTARNAQSVEYIVVEEDINLIKDMMYDGLVDIIPVLEANVETQPYAKHFEIMYNLYKNNPTNDKLLFNAPTLLLIIAPVKIDAALATSSIEIMAHTLNVGSLISGYSERIINANPKIKKELKIEDKEVAVCMLLGYPSVKYHRTTLKKKSNITWR